MSEFDVEEQELFKLRSAISIQPNSTICDRHEARLLKMFVLHQKKCCGPFRKHKKAITSKNVLNMVFVSKKKGEMFFYFICSTFPFELDFNYLHQFSYSSE